MQGKNHITTILLISFSILIGHNLVPHRHHAEALTPPQSNGCPIDHHDCHAFNDIAFVKYNHTEVPVPEKVAVDLSISIFTALPDPHAGLAPAQQICLKLPIRPAPSLNLHFMRAPPFMA